jgi:hypothetical protein
MAGMILLAVFIVINPVLGLIFLGYRGLLAWAVAAFCTAAWVWLIKEILEDETRMLGVSAEGFGLKTKNRAIRFWVTWDNIVSIRAPIGEERPSRQSNAYCMKIKSMTPWFSIFQHSNLPICRKLSVLRHATDWRISGNTEEFRQGILHIARTHPELMLE